MSKKKFGLSEYDLQPFKEEINHIKGKSGCLGCFASVFIVALVLTMISVLSGCSSTESLIKAIDGGDIKKVEQAIKDKVDLNKPDKNGQFPLIKAVEENKSALVEKLITAGADSNVKRSDESSPLHIAIENDNNEIALMLLNSNASIVSKNGKGETPITIKSKNGNSLLHFALRSNDYTLAEQLLTNGASADILNNNNETPLTIAENNKRFDFLTKVYFSQGNIDNVIKYATMAIQNNDKDTGSMYYLGSAYSQKAEASKNAGSLEQEINNYEIGLQYYNKILEIKPNSSETSTLKQQAENSLNIAKKTLGDIEDQKRIAAEQKLAKDKEKISQRQQNVQSFNGEKTQMGEQEQVPQKQLATPHDSKGRAIHVSDTVEVPGYLTSFVGEVIKINGNKVQVRWYDLTNIVGASIKNDTKMLQMSSAVAGVTLNSTQWHYDSKITVTSSGY